MKKPDICQICLRLDRELKVVDQRLAEFHDELCDYVLDPLNSQYCFECAYLLKKMYNFQIRCKNAIFVFKKWKTAEPAKKKPANLLYTLLPQTLAIWTPDKNEVYKFTYEDQETEKSINVEPSDCTLLNNEIKNEMECEDDSGQYSQNLNSFHPQVLKTLEEVTVKDGFFYFNNKEQLHDNDRLSNDGDIIREVDLNDFAVSSDEDINNKIGDENSQSVTNDHCYTKQIEEQKGRHKKKSLTELANISFSDDDETETKSDMSASESISDGNDEEETHKSETKKHIIDNDDTKTQKNKTIANSDNKNKSSDSNKVADIELLNITTNEDNDNIILNKTMLSKERLIAELEKKIEAAGEIKTSDGATIDKQFTLRCLDEKVNESTLRLLWNSIRGRQVRTIQPCTLKIFREIHYRYKNDHQYESVFDIEYLNTEEKVKAEFERRKTYEAIHKCEICYQGFKHEKILEYHNKNHEESAGSDPCTVCSIFCKKEYLEAHMKECHEAIYKCKICPLITYRRRSMINHYNQHMGKQYICEPCGKSYKSLSTYMNHRTAVHKARSTQHVCTLCGRSLQSENALKQHKTRMHSGHSEHVKCSECDVAFASQTLYLKHVRNAHNGLLPDGARAPKMTDVICSECDLTFPAQQVFFRHVRIAHKSVLPDGTRIPRFDKTSKVASLMCNAAGTSYGWLTSHYRTKHPTVDTSALYADINTHLCDVCGKGFTSAQKLRDHMNKHTGSRPFVCGTCSKRFYSYLAMYYHRQKHIPPSKTCLHCGKQFHHDSTLAAHLQVHIRDHRYKCNICGKAFLRNRTLYQHVEGVHHHIRRVRKKGVTESRAKKRASNSEKNSD